MKLLSLILLSLLTTAVLAQEAILLNDFSARGVSSFRSDPGIEGIVMKPTPGVDVAERLFFVADDGKHGEELWRSDGTEVGTQLVKDVLPGVGKSFIQFVAAIGNTVYFVANDGEHGYELWKSQGTAASTQMVVDLKQGSGNGISTRSGQHVLFNDVLYFSGTGDEGQELYRTDGTAAGTTLVKDIRLNLFGATLSSFPEQMIAAQDFFYFLASDNEHGKEIWRSDGTADGTVLLKDINEGIRPANISQMKTFNNTLVFMADDGVNGRELWISLGSTNTTFMVADLTEGAADSDIEILEVVDNWLYFTLKDVDSPRRRLWKTDGDPENTQLVEGLDSNVRSHILYQDSLFFVESGSLWKANGTTEEQVTENISVDGDKLAVFNDELYFVASQGDGGNGLWKTDGTTPGTSLVKEITSGSSRDIDHLFVTSLASGSDTRLYFIADTEEFGRELWASDGTEAGTLMLVDSKPGEDDGFSISGDMKVHDLGGQLVFAGFDEANGRELWKSNGTPEGTTLVKDINTQSEDISLRSNPIGFQNQMFFSTDEGLWQTDGTSENTRLLQEKVVAEGLQVFNDQLIYIDDHPEANARTIWLGDGTTEGSQPLMDSAQAADLRVSFQQKQPQINGSLYFSGQTSELDWKLYKTDGTAEGTALIKDFDPGNEDEALNLGEGDYFILDNTLYFPASTTLQGNELWKTDGTEAGTVPVTDINPLGDSSPRGFLEIDETVFFSANDGTLGRELWKTDGTTNGTTLVKDIFPGSERSDGIRDDVEFVNYQGTLFFSAFSPEFGIELWKSDGTEAGTVMVKNIQPRSGSSFLNSLTVFNDLLLFIARDSDGYKIWRSDGTEEGTQILIDIEAINGFINANGTLFFTATDDKHGRELWRTDGTPEGTQLVQDIFAGPRSSLPILLDYINETLFFTALDKSNGRELWALSPLRVQTELSASSGGVCSVEDSILFTASVTEAGAEPTYQWFLNDQPVANQTSPTFATNGFGDGDKVKVLIVASEDVWVLNDSVFSETITVDFSALAPKITVAGNTLTASEETPTSGSSTAKPCLIPLRTLSLRRRAAIRWKLPLLRAVWLARKRWK